MMLHRFPDLGVLASRICSRNLFSEKQTVCETVISGTI